MSEITEEGLRELRHKFDTMLGGGTVVTEGRCVEVLAIIDELLALRRSHAELVRDAWQPIETAPMDGTEILAFWGPFKIESGAVVDSKAYGVTLYARGSWIDPDDAEQEYRSPSHWRPLRAPPALPKDSP